MEQMSACEFITGPLVGYMFWLFVLLTALFAYVALCVHGARKWEPVDVLAGALVGCVVLFIVAYYGLGC